MSKRAEEAAKEIYKDGIELFGRRDKSGNLVIHPEIMVGILRNAAARCYEQAEKDLGWHPASEYPPVDEEVIVLTDTLGVAPYYEIAVGHIIKEANIWNLRGVKWWMPMPKLPEEK